MISEKLQKQIDELQKSREQFKSLKVSGERVDIDGVDCILHVPTQKKTKLPLFIELHGGAWVAGDSALVDSLCEKICKETPCVAVNLNYKKLDVHPFPYPMEEVLRVIEFFTKNSEIYNIDTGKIVICGQSAGAHIAAGAAVLAKQRSIKIAKQILCYPFLDFTGKLINPLSDENNPEMKAIHELFFGETDVHEPFISPATADVKDIAGVAPAVIIGCGLDVLLPHAVGYRDKLLQAGVDVIYREFDKAMHGFLEVNREDFILPNEAKSDEQKALCEECENFIIEEIKKL